MVTPRAALGRGYDSIEKTCVTLLDVGPDGGGTGALVDHLRWLAAAGIQHVYGRVADQHLITPIEAITAEVILTVADW